MLPTWTLVQDEGLTALAGNQLQNGADEAPFFLGANEGNRLALAPDPGAA